MLKKIIDFIKELRGELTQEQIEAKLDLLLLMMYADRNISAEESAMLKEECEGIEWENPEYYLQLYIDKTVANVRAVVEDTEKMDAFIATIAERLNTDASKEDVLAFIKSFMRVDNSVSEKEEALFAKVIKALGEE